MREAERPSRLKTVLRKIATFQANVILTVVYYAGLGAASVFRGRSEEHATGWTPREAIDPAEHLRSQG